MAQGQQNQELKERLRMELKTWERAFEKQHGRKPSPADVKANAEISAKYKLYHKSFRDKSASSSSRKPENVSSKTEYISKTDALKRITPTKRARSDDVLTPKKPTQVSDDVETVGPTPQLNGRTLGLFDGIQDQTPLGKRRKLNWGEQLAEARKGTPQKSTPRKRILSGLFNPDSTADETPTKSTSSIRSRLTTPITNPSSVCNQHVFATPAFLRPTAQPIQSPQSPSVSWQRLPRTVKGLSDLICDFRANRQELEEFELVAWEDEDELVVTQEHDTAEASEGKPWVKKGAKRSKRRVILRPVPQLEIPPSDNEDDVHRLGSSAKDKRQSLSKGSRVSPELGDEVADDEPFQDSEEPSDLEEARLETEKPKSKSSQAKPRPAQKRPQKKAKPKSNSRKLVSNNFVSYKIRSKGQRGRGRFRRH